MGIYYNLRVRVRKFSHQYSLLPRLLSKLEQNEQLSHDRLVHYLNQKLCLTIQPASQLVPCHRQLFNYFDLSSEAIGKLGGLQLLPIKSQSNLILSEKKSLFLTKLFLSLKMQLVVRSVH